MDKDEPPLHRPRFTEDIMPIVTRLAANALSQTAGGAGKAASRAQFPEFGRLSQPQQAILNSSRIAMSPVTPR